MGEADTSDCEDDRGRAQGRVEPSGLRSVLHNLEMLIDSDATVKSRNKRHNMLLVMLGKRGPLEAES